MHYLLERDIKEQGKYGDDAYGEITVEAESIEEARAIAEEEIDDVFFEPQTPRRYVSSVSQEGVKL